MDRDGGKTFVDTEEKEKYKINLNSRTIQKWLESADGQESVGFINSLCGTKSLLSNDHNLELPPLQARLGVKECLELGWMFEHWSCLHLYSEVIPRIIIEGRSLNLSGTEGVLSYTGSVATSLRKMLNIGKIIPGLQTYSYAFTYVQIYHTAFSHWRFFTSAQTLHEEMKNFLKLMKEKHSIEIPAIGTGQLEFPPEVAAEIIISTALEFFLDNPDCKTILTICIRPEKVKILEVFEGMLKKMKVGAELRSRTQKFSTLTFTGSKEAVLKAKERYFKEVNSVMTTADWTNSPLRNGISFLSTCQIMELETIAAKHNTDVYISKPEKLVRLLGLRNDVEEMKSIVDSGLFTYVKSTMINQMDIPNHWEEGVDEVILEQSSPEYQLVKRQFYGTPTITQDLYTLTKIKRVQNAVLHMQYEMQKRKVIKSLEGSMYKAERNLWHGTGSESIKSICSQGFNRSLAGAVNGCAIGQGTYFAVDPSTSLRYGGNCLLLTKVLTGRYYRGDSRICRSNLKPNFHSTVDNEADPTIFVTYHDAAAYPQYILEYRRSM